MLGAPHTNSALLYSAACGVSLSNQIFKVANTTSLYDPYCEQDIVYAMYRYVPNLILGVILSVNCSHSSHRLVYS